MHVIVALSKWKPMQFVLLYYGMMFIFINNKIQILMKLVQFQLLCLTKHIFYKLCLFSYAIKYRSIH